MIKPPALHPGDTIGIMAPSSRVDPDMLEKACKWLDNYGFRIRIHDQTYAAHHQSAGTAAQKAEALMDLWSDPSVRMILAARGGNRAATFLSLLNYERMAETPKLICGYSDATALINAISGSAGLATFHGPGLNSFINGTEEKHLELAFKLFAGQTRGIPLWGSAVSRVGKAKGRLVGGNLSLIAALTGTPWQPDYRGSILFLEDIGDQLSRYDRMLWQLRNAGLLGQISGLILGNLACAEDRGAVPFGFSLQDCLDDVLDGYDIPVVTNAPFGHGTSLVTLPIGARAQLNAAADGEVTLQLLEDAVAL